MADLDNGLQQQAAAVIIIGLGAAAFKLVAAQLAVEFGSAVPANASVR